MPDMGTLAVFVAASMALLLIPGPAVLYIVARSIGQGRVAGVVSVLGIGVGTLFHVTAAALGLSAILVSSALAFSIVKYLGAAYLIYLGLRKLLVREELEQSGVMERKRLSSVFYQGIVVNLLNPKTALFFFAFLPQFVHPERGPVATQVLVLGLTFTLFAVLSDGMYAMLAGSVGHWLRGNLRFMRAERYITGSVYIGLGVTTALASPASGGGK
ncbi:MAG: LysE family translocator [Chloroflexia bacterium]